MSTEELHLPTNTFALILDRHSDLSPRQGLNVTCTKPRYATVPSIDAMITVIDMVDIIDKENRDSQSYKV